MSSTADIISRQIDMYGEPLSARFRRLLDAYRIPQSKLAAVIGLSAPMLSQLMSGQREKISNPAVLGRIVRLEELAASAQQRPDGVDAVLAEVAASRPALSTTGTHDRAGDAAVDQAAAALAAVADLDDLRAAAGVLSNGPVADVVRRALVLAPPTGRPTGRPRL